MDRRSELLLMAIRCEYIEGPSMNLTKKGKKHISAAKWRLINEAKSLIDSQWGADMKSMILSIEKLNKVSELYPSKK